MNKRLFSNILLLFGIGAGVLSGWLDLPLLNGIAHTTSDLFLRLLKLLSLPLIFLAVSSTITSMRSLQEMKRMGWRILLYTFGTTLVAATIALILFISFQPNQGIDPAFLSQEKSQPPLQPESGYLSFALNLVPSNLFEAFASYNVIGIVFIAALFSLSILLLPNEQKHFLNQLFSSLFAALLKATQLIILCMPIAIWAFIAIMIKDLKNTAHINHLMTYLMCVVAANLIQGIVVLPLLLKWKKISPLSTLRGMAPALTVAFFSKSSNASLPITMRSIETNLGVDRKVSTFSLPLCSVINMNGCAAFILTTVLFVSGAYGVTFNGFELIGWIFLATLAAIGNAGVPMGCFFLTSAFLIGMQIPLTLMGFILPFYAFLDMLETSLNVWSDSCITCALHKDLKVQEEALEPV